ncbi:helix-turn-helix transcriptional regulator [Brevibacillus laterosporus]|uniref:helix-turn-helix domain-containing protein n=1 Tax=Brevibacillus laterosporus TaxID=1465 RepID=UPI002E1F8D9C|nr:helix-turn-helix transcriptional regulator [Brevibacillus laterosporus]
MKHHRKTILQQLRKEKKLTQKEAAQKIGISFSMFSKIENGERFGSYETLNAIATFFETTVDNLCGNYTHR